MILTLMVCTFLLAPAVAQQDERFYGRWEGSGRSSGGGILFFERSDYLSYLNADGQNWFVEKYQVIRDFGDRVVLHTMDIRFPEGDINRNDLTILHLYREGIYRSRHYILLNVDYCGGGDESDYFFKDHDPEAIWQRAMEWNARASEGFPYNRCGLTSDGERKGEGWGNMGWMRYIDE